MALSRLRRSARTTYLVLMPIVIAHHLIWTLYGWWLPNDLRGGTSRSVTMDHIAALGDLHFGRKRVQPAARDVRAFYEQAAKTLKHPLLEIRDEAVDIVAGAFAGVIAQQTYTCYACAIMPDHIHILIRKHKHTAEEMIERLQGAASMDADRCAPAAHRSSGVDARRMVGVPRSSR